MQCPLESFSFEISFLSNLSLLQASLSHETFPCFFLGETRYTSQQILARCIYFGGERFRNLSFQFLSTIKGAIFFILMAHMFKVAFKLISES